MSNTEDKWIPEDGEYCIAFVNLRNVYTHELIETRKVFGTYFEGDFRGDSGEVYLEHNVCRFQKVLEI